MALHGQLLYSPQYILLYTVPPTTTLAPHTCCRLEGSYKRDCLALLLSRAPHLPSLWPDITSQGQLPALLASARSGQPAVAAAVARLLGALLPAAPAAEAGPVLEGLIEAMVEHPAASCRWG